MSIHAANGQFTDHGIPHGYTSLTPFIVVTPAAEAIEFYSNVFGARVEQRADFPGPDGQPIVAHADLDFGTGRLQLGDPNPQYGLVPRPDGDSDCYSMAIYVTDVDAVVQRAVDAGAIIREEVQTFVSGDRFGSVRDPFGVRWSVMTRIEDLSPAESASRIEEWAKQQG